MSLQSAILKKSRSLSGVQMSAIVETDAPAREAEARRSSKE
jgi:hypothetical protein